MKKTIVVILLLLLTSVWSIVFVGASTVQPLGVLPPSNKTLCSPTVLPIGGYNLVLEADTTTTFMLEYFNLQQCFPMQMAITLLQPSQPTILHDTICAGENYTWHGNTYTRPGSYTDTLQNISGCDSIVTLHLEVLPDPPMAFTVNGVSFKMMRVRAGSFIMGALDDDTEAKANERPAHLVTLTRDYFVSETVLTQELWTAVMGTTIQEEEEKRTSGNETNLGYGPNFPMYCLSHKDCQKFVERLNQLTGLTFRMPTEAEWEYAARGGHLSRGYKYPGSNNPSEVAWSIANDPQRKLHPVKLLKPNELGLYDMAGNVWEYIYDCHRTYTTAAQIDPLGDTITNKANIRGGSTAWGTTCSRTSYRHQQSNITKDSKDGRRAFRFVLDADRVIGEDNTTYQAFDTICAGETYTWNGNIYTRPGTYTDTLQNIYGCDSIVTLHLEVLPDPPMTITVNGVSFKMMRVRAGTFMMGATDDDTEAEANEYPAHEVTLTRDYFIGETMLTQELWTAVMGTTAQEEEMGTSGMKGLGYGDDYPMYPLSHYDCQAFVDSLSKLTGLTFRMPTEAEWEYAARGGHLSRGYKYPGSNDPDEVAWTYVTIPDQTIRPVKQLLPNELGLYDMAGNVWEWVLDYNRQYTATPQVDPIGELDTTMAFVRGGSTYFRYEYKHIRVSSRGDEFAKTYKNTRMGFRFVLDAKGVLENNQIYLIRDTICAGETYTWNGNTYTTPGAYTDTLTNIYGCDSIVTMHLQVNPTYEVHDTVVACDSYEWHGEEYHNSGIYYDSLLTIHGCDSVEILHLTINNSSTQEYHITSCVSYTWKEDKTYTQSGVYYDSLLTINGCDSVEILYLIILPPTEHFVTDTMLCHGITYTWRDSVYTTTGTYNDTVRNMLLCDSIIYTLNLQYLPDVVYVEEDTLLCHGVTCEWRNKPYTTAGTYNDTVRNMLLCDSIIYTLNLQYLPDVVYVKEDTLLCHGVTCEWRNKPYTTAGSYNDTVRNMLLCDSIIYTLNLLIHPEIPITHVTDTMAGPEYHWNEQIYTTGGEYSVILPAVTGCDSVVVLHLLSNPAAIDTVILYEQCAGSGEQEIEILTQGFISQIALRYSPKALAAGWQDTIMPFSSNDLYTLSYRDIRAGIYEATAVGLFHDVEVATYSFTLTYLYPTTIFEQRYNDLITVLTHDYNGGYDFVAFQWYKDGVLIPDATHSYLNQSLGFEAEYSVLLTDTNGLALMSCPIIAEDKAELSVYPTILQPGGSAKVSITESNVLYIHDSTGKIIQEHHLEQGITDISMPIVSGVYLLRFVSNDHIERTFKLIVQ